MIDPVHRRARTPLWHQIVVWLEQHRAAAIGTLRRLLGAPLASQLTIAVIAVGLVLPAALQVVAENSRAATRGLEGALDVSVFLKLRTTDTQGRAITQAIGARPDVQAAHYVSPEEGLVEFRHWSGLGPALDALGRNPLPGAVVVRPRATAVNPATIDRLVGELRALPEVDQVQFDGQWVRRYTSLVDAIGRLAEILGGLLAMAVVLIVGNTVRLDVDARRHEIEIMTLVGASDGFVRRPALYTGFWYGLLGGIASVVLLEGLVWLSRGPISRAAAAYGSAFTVASPSAGLVLLLVVGGAILGWLGAFAAAARHLREFGLARAE